MKLQTISCSLQTLLIIINLGVQQGFSQLILNYNECNIKHCISCNNDTKLCTKCEDDYNFDREQLLCISVLTCPLGGCEDCHPRCKQCLGPTINDCFDCVDGHILGYKNDETLQCVSCGVQNCKICFSKEICNVCVDGYVLNKETEQCYPCFVKNCKKCNTNPGVCDLCFSSHTLQTKNDTQVCALKGECNQGEYMDTSGCKSCDISCNHCFGPDNDKCYSCSIGYYLNRDNQCQKCNSSCFTCQYSDDYCTSCNAQFALNGSKCQYQMNSCDIDQEEYFNNGKCEPCPLFCKKCSNLGQCTACVSEFFKLLDGKCVYSDQFCNYENNCITCKENNILSNKRCITKCEFLNEYIQYDPINKIKKCTPCPYPCITCKDRFTCLGCVSTKFKLQNGQCLYDGYPIQYCSPGISGIGNSQIQRYLSNIKYLNDQCLDQCPAQFKLSRNYCHCNFICNDCTLFNLEIDQCRCQTKNLYQLQGKCQTQCLKNQYYYLGQLNYYCVDECPKGYLTQISKKEIKCVKKCENGFDIVDNRICGQFSCQRGEFFDYDKFLILIKSEKQQECIDNLSQFCKPCDKACATCYGELKSNCFLCSDKYYYYLRDSLQIDCIDYCPGHIENKVCQIPTTGKIQLKQTMKVQNSFSNQKDIDVILNLTEINLQPKCSLHQQDDQFISFLSLDKLNKEIEEYQAVIQTHKMEEGQVYNIKCSIENKYYYFQELIEEIKIYKLKGNFDVNQEFGYPDTFYLNITKFYLININPENYNVKYQIEYKDRDIQIDKTTLFAKNYLFDNNPTQINNSPYIFNITFTEIKKPTCINIFLSVYILDSKQNVFEKSIYLKPTNETNKLDVISPALNNIITFAQIKNNFQFNISEFTTFIQDLKNSNLIPNLDNSKKHAILIQQNEFNRKYVKKSFTCEQIVGCSCNGKCKTDIISYFEKCDCDYGYMGESCGWKIVDLEVIIDICSQASKQIRGLIKYNFDKSLELDLDYLGVLTILNDLVQIRDIFQNISIYEQFFEHWMDLQRDFLNSADLFIKFLQFNDNAIIVYRKFQLSFNKIIKRIENTLNSKSAFLYLGQSQNYTFNNINIFFKNLNVSNEIPDPFVQFNDTTQNQWKVLIPKYIYCSFYDQCYLQVIDLPSDSQLYRNDSNYFVASRIIIATIRKKNDPNEVHQLNNNSLEIKIKFNRLIKQEDIEISETKNTVLNCIEYVDDIQRGIYEYALQSLIDQGDDNIQCSYVLEEHKKIYLKIEIKDKYSDFETTVFLVLNTLLISLIIPFWCYKCSDQNDFQYQQQQLQQKLLKDQQKLNQQSQQQQKEQLQQQSQNQQQGQQLQKQGNQIDVSCFHNTISFICEKEERECKVFNIGGQNLNKIEEQKHFEGIPIQLNNNENQKKINEIKLEQVNIPQNPQNHEIFSFDILRRPNEEKIDELNQKGQDINNNQNIQKEINLVPNSILEISQREIQSQLNFKTKQNKIPRKSQIQPFNPQINERPIHQVQRNENMPQGIQDQQQVQYEQEEEQRLQEYKNQQIQQQEIQQVMQIENLKYSHPFYSFTHLLEYADKLIRIGLFLQMFSLYQFLTIFFMNMLKITNINQLNFANIMQIFFEVMLIKSTLQYAIPLLLKIISLIKKYFYGDKQFTYLKFAFIFAFNILLQIIFCIEAAQIQYMIEFKAFVVLFFFNIIIDYFVLDFLIIKLQLYWQKKFLLILIRYKNLDFEL